MPIAIRSAKTTWTDSLAAAHGVIEVGTEGIDSLDVTWTSRIKDHTGTRRAPGALGEQRVVHRVVGRDRARTRGAVLGALASEDPQSPREPRQPCGEEPVRCA